ncbi:tubulin-like doman-containing protein [Maridesulfovibrio hydrothermalis]|uniref:Tubulin like n=1 Tax=Maridesulfovibrio hydrothermalis AM13 = DSM 14728 TaxID=1121451 RepID=L0RAE2_9BACT|nr:tubulin-like doman-containing protein [Maridesulfovibrio hydrothermalis]CCO23748.1 protein of unknown function [Maridesulfovibrio hydrothermalis AM13 = DSM 14728]
MKKNKMLNPIHKTMVIGLGGTGKETLVQVKRRLYEEGYDETMLQPYIKLLSLDFDPALIRTRTLDSESVDITLDTSEETAISSAQIFERIKNLQEPSNKKYFESWYPDMENSFIRMGAHRAGAAQWRPLGRIGYFEHVKKIQQTLDGTLKALQEDSKDDTRQVNSEVVVYIVSSLSGGTGAGLLLDVAYFMRSLNPNMRIVGMLLLPGVYSEHDIQGRLYSNTYAMLKELTAFMGQSHEFRASYPTGRPIKGQVLKNSPFDLVFLHDATLGPDRVASNPQTMAELIGESIYLEIGNSYLNQSQSSALTNMVQYSGGQAMDEIAGKTFFNTMGNVTFQLPSFNELYAYWANRAVLEIFSPDQLQEIQKDKTNQLESDSGHINDFRPASSSKLEVEKDILKIVDMAVKKSIAFTESFIIHAGKEMGASMYEHSPDVVSQDVEKYVTAFLNPQWHSKGEMPFAPYRLPDNMNKGENDNTNPSRALSAVLDEVDEVVSALLDEVQNPFQLDQAKRLITCLENCTAVFDKKAEKFDENAKERTLGVGGVLEKSKAELEEFIHEVSAGVRKDALCHWAVRFFQKLSYIYDDEIGPLRIYRLVAGSLREQRDKLQQIINNKETKLQEADGLQEQVRVELKEQARSELESFKRNCSNRSTLVLRTMVNEAFLERTWKKIAPELQKKTGTYTARLRQVVSGQDFGGREIYLAAKTVIFGILKELKKEFRNSPKARLGSDIFDLCGYIDYGELKAELGRARHDHFIVNTVENESSHNIVYALLPTYGPASSKQESGIFYKRFRDCINNNMESVGGSSDTYSMEEMGPDEPGRIVVRHISMNHPSYNLRDIGYYYSAYCKHGKNKALAHIHKEYARLPEIVLDSQVERFVTCGNNDCSYDITHLSREELTCPGCNRPILSRCGNPGCPEDHLNEHAAILSGDDRIFCPTCKKRIKTRWWYCNDHNVLISRESSYCKLCLQEYAAGDRYFEDVSMSEEVVPHFPCPGCLTTGQENPFKVTFSNVYDEVKDEDVPEALKIYFSTKTPQGRCPKCSSLLLPVCPYYEPNDNETPHFVQRGEGSRASQYHSEDEAREMELQFGQAKEKFFCTSDQDHAQKCIRECSYCGLPLREDAKYCPRCQRKRVNEIQNINDEASKAKKLQEMNHHNQLYFGDNFKKDITHTCTPQKQLDSEQLIPGKKKAISKQKSEEASHTRLKNELVLEENLDALEAFKSGKEEGYGGQ